MTSNSEVEGWLVTNATTDGTTFFNNPGGTAGASVFGAINAVTIGPGSYNFDDGGGVNWVVSDPASFILNGGGSVKQDNPKFSITGFTTPTNTLVNQLNGLTANSTVNGSGELHDFTFDRSLPETAAAEPASRAIIASGLAGLGAIRRHRESRQAPVVD